MKISNKRSYRRKRKVAFKPELLLKTVKTFVMERKILSIVIAGAAVFVVLLLTGVFPFFSLTPKAPASADVPSQDEVDAYYSGVDEETLAGLSGSDDSMFTDSGDVSDKDHIIGISVLSPNVEDYQLLAYIDKAANASIDAGQIDNFIMYDANGDATQQQQDVLTLINGGANTIVVMGTDNYTFQKISELCSQNNVKIVACNVDATEGFAVNIMSQANHSKKFAEFSSENGATGVYTVDATETEVNTIREIVPVTANIEGDEASSNIADRLNLSEPVWNLVFFDNSANSVLKTYIEKGIVPKTIATPAYVGFIKTWYNLLHDGVTFDTLDDEGNVTATSKPFKSDSNAFHAIAYTQVTNMGEIVYKFAYNLSVGKKLAQDNYVYEVAGEQYITNENLEQYYTQIGSLDNKSILSSSADVSGIDALFTE